MPLSGKRLRNLRQQRGLSLDDLAAETGISRAYLWKLEVKPSQNPSLELLEKLAEALHTTVGELADSVPPPKPESVPQSLRICQERHGLSDRDLGDLSRIRFRGGQPTDPEDWYLLFLQLKRAMRND